MLRMAQLQCSSPPAPSHTNKHQVARTTTVNNNSLLPTHPPITSVYALEHAYYYKSQNRIITGISPHLTWPRESRCRLCLAEKSKCRDEHVQRPRPEYSQAKNSFSSPKPRSAYQDSSQTTNNTTTSPQETSHPLGICSVWDSEGWPSASPRRQNILHDPRCAQDLDLESLV